ncbi:small ribosomal subunit protein bTHXm-like [Silene latifolia]|uniref:small ribosomal subunit protein bTHXm-like n=1 Tax=Silene latifolia TaxID=37657 RepID=UPI003D7870B6
MALKQLCNSFTRRIISTQKLEIPNLSSFSTLSSSSTTDAILCGRGDKKTKKGKRFKGSYGNIRPKKKEMIERLKDKVEVPQSTPWPLPFKLI